MIEVTPDEVDALAMAVGRLIPSGFVHSVCAIANAAVGSLASPDALAMSPRRRREFLTGRQCAATCLGALGVEGSVGRGMQGQPVWPNGVVGSIAHSSTHAIAVAGRGELPIGIDCEHLERADTRALYSLVTAQDARPVVDPSLHALVQFSMKEAVFKSVPAGTASSLRDITLCSADAATFSVQIGGLDRRGWWSLTDRHVVCLAIAPD